MVKITQQINMQIKCCFALLEPEYGIYRYGEISTKERVNEKHTSVE
jgi:hypothetical protein